jgi:hypothetical protein
VKVSLVVLFYVWLQRGFVAILTSGIQCTRHTAGFGNITLLSNVGLFHHMQGRVFSFTVEFFLWCVFWHGYFLGFRGTAHTVG